MEKKNTGLIIIVIVLSVLVVGLSGYIVYDKILSTSNTTTNQKEASSIDTDNKINKKYSVGDEITFNNEKWNVIKESNESDDYVVVLKSTVLDELTDKPYYNCPAENDNGLNCNMQMWTCRITRIS